MLRDLEVENGADAPRIHSMDDYFMVEVEKVGPQLLLMTYYSCWLCQIYPPTHHCTDLPSVIYILRLLIQVELRKVLDI